MAEFRALNNFARAMGESLREKVNLAIPDSILDMRFSQDPEDLIDDEQFLHATYRAGIQVEKMKALKGAWDIVKGAEPPRDDQRKDRQNKGCSDDARKGKRENNHKEEAWTSERKSQYGQTERWASKDAALAGLPAKEQEEYGCFRDDCWRCGRNSHRTYECFSFNTKRGTPLPPAPWKALAVAQGKRKRSEEPKECDAARKQQKVAAVETMDADAAAPYGETVNRIFKSPGTAVTQGHYNNMRGFQETKKLGTKRWNPVQETKETRKQHSPGNQHGAKPGRKKTPNPSAYGHGLFHRINQ